MVWDFDYSSVSSISALLNGNGLCMSKKFGQNFLINTTALNKIADIADVKENSKVWEIGPGVGALTSILIKRGASVTAFEIDRGFCRILKEQAFPDCRNFKLVEGDVLKNWKEEYEKNGKPDLVCANLPYNIGSVFIASLIENRCLVPKMVFTLQTEVVKRMCSDVGDSEYSGFSILTSIDYNNKEVLKLKNTSFWPAPKVDSSVVSMTLKDNRLIPEEQVKSFIRLCRVLFAQRRKTVKNNLKALQIPAEDISQVLSKAGISETERAEKLTTKQLLTLTRNLLQV